MDEVFDFIPHLLCYGLCVRGLPDDTSPDVLRRLEEGLRVMSPAQKVARVAALTELSHAFALAQIRRLHPQEGERAHRLRLMARWIDAATMRAAFDWPPTP